MADTKLQNHIDFIPNNDGRTLMYVDWQCGGADEIECVVKCELHLGDGLEILSAYDYYGNDVEGLIDDNNIERLESFINDTMNEEMEY